MGAAAAAYARSILKLDGRAGLAVPAAMSELSSTDIRFASADPDANHNPPLMGLARLMTMAFLGADLAPIAAALIARAQADDQDANALMDLSTVLQLQGLRDIGLGVQAQALQVRRHYRLRATTQPEGLRLLAIMVAGDLMSNTPLPFLLQDSDVTLDMLYLQPDEALPDLLPAHDQVFIAIAESDVNRELLARLDAAAATWPRQVHNRPARIASTCREQAHALLNGAQGIHIPIALRVSRDALAEVAAGQVRLSDVLADSGFPVILRPVDSHAGHGLAKIQGAADIAAYLEAHPEAEFFISRFVDYRGIDGQFRKYRVVLIDGLPYAGHMAISSHWMVHYLNAGMTDSESKRQEEARFMRTFDEGFARRHGAALKLIGERFGLGYLVIDCAETPDGRLLVFEVDPSAVLHSMDPEDLFPYKPAQMRKVFTAFRRMLADAAA